MSSHGDELKDLIAKAGMQDHPGIKKLSDSPLLPDKARAELVKLLKVKAALNCPKSHPFLPGPEKEAIAAGDIALGQLVTGHGPDGLVWLPGNVFLTHGIVVGSVGKGKTIVLCYIGLQPHTHGVPVWYFVTEHDISAYVLGSAPDTLIITHRDIELAAFEGPPGCGLPWREYLGRFTDSIRHPLVLGDGMINLLLDTASALKKSSGSFGVTELFHALLGREGSLKTRAGGYFEGMKNRFEGTLLPYFAKTFGTGSHDIRALMRRSVVWELVGLPTNARAVFVSVLLLWVLLTKRASTTPTLDLLVLIDELTQFIEEAGRQGGDFLGRPMLSDFLMAARKRGVGVLMATQLPHRTPANILGMCNFWLTFRPADGEFRWCVSKALDLNAEQQTCLVELPARRAIVRSPNCPKPFLIELPELALKPASDEELAKRREESREWLRTIYKPGKVTGAGQPAVVVGGVPPAKPKPICVACKAVGFALGGEEHAVLEAIAKRPAEEIQRRCEKLGGMDRAKESVIRGMLITQGLVCPAGTVGNKRELFDLTDKGREWADSHGISVPRTHGKVPHEFIIAVAEEALLAAFPGMTFTRRGSGAPAGVRPDSIGLLPGEGGKRIAIQAVWRHDPTGEAENLLKLCSPQVGSVDFVLCLATNKGVGDSVRRAIKRKKGGSTPEERLAVLTVEDALCPGTQWTTVMDRVREMLRETAGNAALKGGSTGE